MLKRDFFRDIVLLGLILVLFLCLRLFVFSFVTVKEASSNSYLRTGDVLLISKDKTPKLRDFVQYKVDGQKYLGRIVAKSGDRVTYMEDIFYRNDQVEDENYLTKLRSVYLAKEPSQTFTEDFDLTSLTGQETPTIPAGYYLILNDNRRNQQDSRQFGLIHRSQIRGVVEFRLLPWADFGFIQTE